MEGQTAQENQTVPPITKTEPTQTTEKRPEDLITRVSQFKETVDDKNITEPEFDFKDIEAIQDPVAKEQALKAYKSFQKGFNQKFQEISNVKKTLEQQIQLNNGNWTPEKIQTLLQNPEFVKAAQSVAGIQSSNMEEDGSLLSDKEKQKIASLESEIKRIQQLNYQTIKSQQDEQLKGKYANYNPQAVDVITADLLEGKYNATREDLWKVYDYENAVKRAYQLGLQDKQQTNKEKVEANSIDGYTAVPNNSPIKKEANESTQDFVRKLFLNNMNKQKTEQIRK